MCMVGTRCRQERVCCCGYDGYFFSSFSYFWWVFDGYLLGIWLVFGWLLVCIWFYLYIKVLLYFQYIYFKNIFIKPFTNLLLLCKSSIDFAPQKVNDPLLNNKIGIFFILYGS